MLYGMLWYFYYLINTLQIMYQRLVCYQAYKNWNKLENVCTARQGFQIFRKPQLQIFREIVKLPVAQNITYYLSYKLVRQLIYLYPKVQKFKGEHGCLGTPCVL